MRLLALERIAANKLAKTIGFMRGGALVRPHFIEYDARSCFGRLKCRLAACEPCANNVDNFQTLVYGLLEIVLQDDAIARFARFEMIEGFVRPAHRKFFGDRGDIVTGAEI